jgi:putative tryptophan/tyrosine transport system substrate-binding protein
MKRRAFITLLGGGTVAWQLVARAEQPGRIWRIGFIAGGEHPASVESSFYNGFSVGMRELGYAEGKDFIIEWRFAENRTNLFPAIAAELVRLSVDVIVVGAPAAVRPAQQATKAIPIVMAISVDPVGQGLVTSLAHPGGNTTGLANSLDDVLPKELELLRMAVTNLARVALIVNPKNPVYSTILNIARAAAEKTSVALILVKIATADEIPNAFDALVNGRPGAVIVAADPLFSSRRQQIAELAIKARLPTIFGYRENVQAGGLMSYGESIYEFYQRAAFYVDKILKGSKPSDLPIQQPTRFLLVINRKTAEAIGLTLSPNLLALADEVIE